MEPTLSKTAFFRCTPEMWRELEQIADQSVAKNISDHIRYALEQYIENEKKRLGNKNSELPN